MFVSVEGGNLLSCDFFMSFFVGLLWGLIERCFFLRVLSQ